ncbi:hypothetical protein GQ457_03G016580 [Hibiscus cannabinus]
MGYRLTSTKAISINLRSLMRRRHREENTTFFFELKKPKGRTSAAVTSRKKDEQSIPSTGPYRSRGRGEIDRRPILQQLAEEPLNASTWPLKKAKAGRETRPTYFLLPCHGLSFRLHRRNYVLGHLRLRNNSRKSITERSGDLVLLAGRKEASGPPFPAR